jgi:ABC-type uncharacterized transport system YnjBCD ATPase subunit
VAREDVPGPHGDAEGAGESYEQIEHHPTPSQPGGETDFAAAAPGDEPAVKQTGTAFSARERERQRERAGEEEFAYHSGTVRPSEAPDAIEFIDVHKSFGRNHVLRGLNMGLPEDKISMIIGPSGTGKSVCIKHIVGLLYPDEGDVLVHGVSIPSLPDAELFEIRKKFGVLFQDGALFGSLTLWDNVAFPLRQHTEKGDEEIAEIVNRRMSEVGLGGEGAKMPNELSGGRARARPRDRAVRRARLRLGPRAHGASVRADQGNPRRERRLLRGDHARHHERAPRRRAHLCAVEGPDRRIRASRGSVRVGKPLRAAVPGGRISRPPRHGVGLAAAVRAVHLLRIPLTGASSLQL